MEKKVLVVQGDDRRRGAIRDALAACGVAVVEASSAADAMGLVKNDAVDGLVVNDESRQLALRGLCGMVKRAREEAPVFVLLHDTSDLGRIATAVGHDAVLLPSDSAPEQVAVRVTERFGGHGPRLWTYEKVRPLRRSKLWESHVALSPRSRTDVFLTQLADQFARDSELRGEFMDGLAPLEVLDHPNLPRLRDVDGGADIPFVAQDFESGESLAMMLRRFREASAWPSARLAAWITGEIAAALEAAHAVSCPHGALSPESVWLTVDGRVLVLYLGIAGYCTMLERTMRSPGHLAIANLYVAPEQLVHESPDARTDLFLLGLVFNDLLTRQPLLFREDERRGIERGPRPHEAFVELALSCLERNPSVRPQSAASFRSKLAAAVQATSGEGHVGTGDARRVAERAGAPAITSEARGELQRLMRQLL